MARMKTDDVVKDKVPKFAALYGEVFKAMKDLGGSASNEEISNSVAKNMRLPEEEREFIHQGNYSMTEFDYQLAWARTYLKNAGIIQKSKQAVWSITPEFSDRQSIDTHTVKELIKERNKQDQPQEKGQADPSYPDEVQPWQEHLAEILQAMDPYAFENLIPRLLRECGFEQVNVTKKSRDGGIDGTGKLVINGFFSFTVAFQCKRYKGCVGAPEIRDFRGSLTTDNEKGLFITTGTFSQAAIEEASQKGKIQIDLIDGTNLIEKLAVLGIGVKEVTSYVVDEEYFKRLNTKE